MATPHEHIIGLSAWFNSDRDRTGALTDVAYCDRFGRIVAFSHSANIGSAQQGGISLNATLRPLDFMNIMFYANLFDDYSPSRGRPAMAREPDERRRRARSWPGRRTDRQRLCNDAKI